MERFMKYNLKLFLKYNSPNSVNLNLASFRSIMELDHLTRKFSDSSSLKNYFANDIQEFILDLRDNKNYRENKDKMPITYLLACEKDLKSMNFFKIAYMSDAVFYLKDNELYDYILDVFLNIALNINAYKKSANDNTRAKNKKHYGKERSFADADIFLKELGNAGITFPLSEEAISYWLKFYCHNDVASLKRFYNSLKIIRKKGEGKWLDSYNRILLSSSNIQKYLPILKSALVKNGNYCLESEGKDISSVGTIHLDRYTDDVDDDNFMQFIRDENYDELFANYDVDKILKYSKDLKNPLGLRRK